MNLFYNFISLFSYDSLQNSKLLPFPHVDQDIVTILLHAHGWESGQGVAEVLVQGKMLSYIPTRLQNLR